jgi:hypothetical protein
MSNKDESWQEVNASNSETWDREEPLIGTYLGFKHITTKNGESILYSVKTDNGTFGAWGSAVLDSKLAEVEVGSMVKIAFLGKVENPKSGRTYNDFSVMVKPAEKSVGGINVADIPF